ncbi:MAG: protein kinase, partial [Myxococcota bacterium]
MTARIQTSTILGSYRVVSELAQGGMGVIYLAEHRETGEQVALKTLRTHKETQLRSLRREINVMTQLDHPGVVQVYEEGQHGGIPWYAMAYLEGKALSWHLREQRRRHRHTPPDDPSFEEGLARPDNFSEVETAHRVTAATPTP